MKTTFKDYAQFVKLYSINRYLTFMVYLLKGTLKVIK
jgi:hypothetical protein